MITKSDLMAGKEFYIGVNDDIFFYTVDGIWLKMYGAQETVFYVDGDGFMLVKYPFEDKHIKFSDCYLKEEK